jgi:hypothetical protein
MPLLVFLCVQLSVKFFTISARGSGVAAQTNGIYWAALEARPVAIFLSWRNSPHWAGPPHYRGFTITLGKTPLDELSARRKDIYVTTYNTHKRQISMPPAGFEPTIPASEFSGMGGPNSNYATASRALRVILLHRPHNDDKI